MNVSQSAAGLQPGNIPVDMRSTPQWVGWRYEERDGKATKVLYQAHWYARADSTNPATWATFDQALAAMKRYKYDGIGFVLANGWAGVDFDKCRDPLTGTLAPWAAALLVHFAKGTYIEVSPSGEGLHAIGKGKLPGNRHKTAYHDGAVEMYDANRFFTVTGNVLSDGPIDDITEHLATVYAQVFPPQEERPALPSLPSPTQDDQRVLELAFAARNGGETRHLYDGGTRGDHSAADLALLSRLAFYTQDPAQLDRLFRTSALYRGKWERADYRDRTIARALDQRDTYNPGPPPQPAATQPDERDAVIAQLLAEKAELEEKLRQAEEVALTAVRAEASKLEWQRKYAECAERTHALEGALRSRDMDPDDKQVGIATIRHLEARRDSPKHTDPELGTRVNREAVANLAGVSPDSVTKAWKKFTEAGLWKRSVTKRYNEVERHPETTVWLSMDGTLIERTQALASVELPRRMGGKRDAKAKITCTVCGSADLHRHAYSECHDCGHTWGKAERPINPPEDRTLVASQENQDIETLVASTADTPPTVEATPPKQEQKEWVIPPAGPGITDMSTLWDDIPPAEIYRPVRTVPIRGWGAS